jgi:serine/threonine-protein kinase
LGNTATTKNANGESVLVGSVLSGRYRVLRPLGEGGIGRVYEVEHLQIGGRFALKILKSEHAQSADAVERFRREAKLGARLRSPYTVAVFDFDVADRAPFLVMEYLDGMTLQKLLAREGLLSVPRASRLLQDACRGTQAAHVLGILHRDLKPSNLFVIETKQGESCKVLDFGIAKQTEQYLTSSVGPSTSTGAILGTLAYMPPEQIRGEQGLDERADVYSLGAILYECLAGRRLYEAATPPALMYKILEEEPVSLSVVRPELPPALIACVERAIRRRPDERFSGVFAFEQALIAATGGRSAGTVEFCDDATRSDTSTGASQFSIEQPAREAPAPSKGTSRVFLIALGAAGLGVALGRGLVPRTAAFDGRPNEPASAVLRESRAPSAQRAPEPPSPPLPPSASSPSSAFPANPPAPSASPLAPSASPANASAPSAVTPAARLPGPRARPPERPSGGGQARPTPSVAPSAWTEGLRSRFDRENPYLNESKE